MVARIGPGYPIAPPTYQPPMHSLLASAVLPPDEPDERWGLGFEFEPEGQTRVEVTSGWVCDPDDKPDKPAQTPPPLVNYRPFQLVTTYSCPWGRTDAEREAKVRRQLDAGETKALERELWTGGLTQLDNDLYLTNPANDVNLGEQIPLDVAFARCARYLASLPTGARGMIHVTPYVAEKCMKAGIDLVEDGRGGSSILRTKTRGDIVVVGSGYTGTGPAGAPPPPAGQVFIYCTPMIHIRRGPVQIYGRGIEGVRRTSNSTWTHIAERTAAVYWDGTPAAFALVDLGEAVDVDITGGAITSAATAPSSPLVGDLWIDTDDSDRQFKWNGVEWVELGV